MDYGNIVMNIEKLLAEKGISKNKICRELELSRPNFNRYCQNKFQRIDSHLICKLCSYLGCSIGDIMTYIPPKNVE